jgi:putative transposase
LAAPLLFEGPCNPRLFNAWLAQALCPLLQPQHVVVLANVPFHKSAPTKAVSATTGATLLFLPPYSPDLNPIEHDFAAIKKLRAYNAQLPLALIVRAYKYSEA